MPQPVRRNDLLQRFTSAESVVREILPILRLDGPASLPCGIAILDGRNDLVHGGSDEFAETMEYIQSVTREGPGLQVLADGRPLTVDEVGEAPWPIFGVAARLHGLQSLHCEALKNCRGRYLGTITWYSRRPNVLLCARSERTSPPRGRRRHGRRQRGGGILGLTSRLAGAAVPAGAAVLAGAGIIVMQPRRPARALARSGSRVLFAGPPARREVALTFDDGPDARTTPALLEVLRRHGAQATFFLIGSRAAELPGLARRIAEDGHEIAHHMWRDTPSVLSAKEKFERDFLLTHEVLTEICGVAPRAFRPASGWYSPRMVRTAADHGCRTVLASIAPRDLALGGHAAGVVLYP